MAIGSLRGRVLTSGADPLGRWVFCKMRRNSGPPITIITTYQAVNVDPALSGPTTYVTQLHSQYTDAGRHEPAKLRKHHSTDLVNFVKACQSRGEWIIIAGDLNETIGLSPGGMNRLCSECHLYDAVVDKHVVTDFTTYQRGSSVLDYFLVDDNIRRTIHATGYEPFGLH